MSLCVAVFFCTVLLVGASSAEKSVFKGRTTDVDGKNAEGVRVFLYDSPDVRRPADFISAGTGKDGLFYMVAPPGRYWAVARLKKAEGYGPLMPGDKHSGEPVEIELVSGSEVRMDFVVADLKEAVRIRTRDKGGPVKISGRILDENGSALMKAYAFASKTEKISGIPDYLSAWVDSEGRYTMYVPSGTYYVGAALTFPPGDAYFMRGEIRIDSDKSDMDIIKKAPVIENKKR